MQARLSIGRGRNNTMATCSRCGDEFNVSTARRSIGQKYGAGSYDDFFPDGDVCEDCADLELGSAEAEGAEVMDLMGWEWD